MSKLSFRARALDAAKPLPVYRNKDLPDLNDCVSINRAVPQMPTGMEKEEELEHHLQRAISAQSVFREKKEHMVIPVPEAESNITYYDRLYKGELKVPKQLMHIQPLGLDNEEADYDMDSEDETLLNRLNRKMEIKPLQFETMVDRLEKASTNQLVSLPEAKVLLNEDDYLLKSVYDYWVRKKKNCRGPSLIPLIKLEKRDGSTNSDAYVAFRRRTEKMQTRKNRKNDEASYEKMLKLRREFSRTVTILEMIKRREKAKRELLHLTLEVVEKRYQLGDFTGEVLSEVTVPLAEKPAYIAPVSLANGMRHKTELKIKTYKAGLPYYTSVKEELPFDFVRPKKKYTKRDKLNPPRRPGRPPSLYTVNKADIKQYDFHSSGEEDFPSPPSEPDEENDPDGVFAFRRKAGCQYLSPCAELNPGPLWEHPELAGLDALRHRHSLTALCVPRRFVGLARRRMGRGGRVVLDRASSGTDAVLRQLDPEVVTQPGATDSPAPLQRGPGQRCAPSTSLSEILDNIQALRWRCFRPRPSQDHNQASKTSRLSTDCRLAARLSACPRNGIGGITEEQYQDHQQQLAQMQKQQLAQTSTAPVKHSSQPELKVTQVGQCTLLSSLSNNFQENTTSTTSMGGGGGGSGTTTTTSTSHSGGPRGLGRSSSSTTSSSLQSLPNARSHVSAVSPANSHHSARPSAPSPSALKLATAASALGRVPKVPPASTGGTLPR
uniref:Enhancer of polycomb homolog n=1 Tax=Gadus morhua TaxID=8049 RepID=A0A8C5C3W8_GADMO